MGVIKKKKKVASVVLEDADENYSYFFRTFIGEYVQVTTDMKASEQVSNEDGSVFRESPLVFEGFLLDEDKDFYFLGMSPDEVQHAVKKICVKHISIVPTRSIYDDLLESLPEPNKKEGFN